MADIVLDGVTKRYRDGTVAVADLDLRIADGEFIILVGPSGSGKSTTLNMIAGLEEISDGELRIDGERMNERAPRDRDIAMIFQSYALYPHMTVRQNIGFPLKLAKMDKAAMNEKVEHAAGLLGLTPYLERKPGQLSGGQRQRVAMGRAIVRSPKAFLMDEPLSNLDARLRVQMRTTISRLQKDLGTTTVYVTHDQTEAMTLGDRIVIMKDGLVQQIGSPQELYDRPRNLFVAGFIGSPPMNFLPGELGPDGLHCPLGTFPPADRMRPALREDGRPREVIVGVRPESFEDAALVPDPGPATFTGTVDILESLGAEKIAFFDLGAQGMARSEHLEALSRDRGTHDLGDTVQIAVRIDPRSQAAENGSLKVWFDREAVHLFDPESGATLTEV
ncbi:ABC transporter ATP-binding protein [Thermomonospora umbrina]|uniref:Carbohydrate ABC transporter ATP-binding protein (CUT1 family) n=1 Tax=Thermomonospora umbrina TaxID=111806 RepID=A0A3D9SLM6_9ACTN|nr:sn-glycerol-3-phosphate ABC transporter ATP-binding protein UgpC [Thermomonospora umbrina]REE96758.1 carbohydrate ABC transporter ATP-binding protein (CUT1 family) [Thermomonospora umbrina]